MKFPSLVNMTNPYKKKGLLGGIFHFYAILNRKFCKQTVKILIWVCTGCICPKKDASLIWASTRENLSSGVCEQHRRSLISAFIILFFFLKVSYVTSLQVTFQFSSWEDNLKLALTETPKTGFLATRPIWVNGWKSLNGFLKEMMPPQPLSKFYFGVINVATPHTFLYTYDQNNIITEIVWFKYVRNYTVTGLIPIQTFVFYVQNAVIWIKHVFLCNITSAGPRGWCWNPSLKGEGFNDPRGV